MRRRRKGRKSDQEEKEREERRVKERLQRLKPKLARSKVKVFARCLFCLEATDSPLSVFINIK